MQRLAIHNKWYIGANRKKKGIEEAESMNESPITMDKIRSVRYMLSKVCENIRMTAH